MFVLGEASLCVKSLSSLEIVKLSMRTGHMERDTQVFPAVPRQGVRQVSKEEIWDVIPVPADIKWKKANGPTQQAEPRPQTYDQIELSQPSIPI